MPDPITRLNAALEGRYRIESELGEGGMATVYLADDLKHERKVALKVLKPELAAVVGAERFLAEIKTTANLQHPHILPLFDSGEADSFLFYVMPFVEGETLRERIDRDRQLPVDEALGIATAIANALHTAHEQGVVHRDIKPGNILMSRGEPLVADFGIALAVSAGGGGRLTETGLSLGTPYYMSPEQATGDQAVGPASDTFALACVLYEMLVGDPPYPGSTAQAVLGKIIQGVPVSATAVRQTVPPNVDAAIRKALEKLPADRFTGAQDFARALADPGFRHGEEAGVGAGVVGGALWNRLSIATTVLAVVASGVAAWALFRPDRPLPLERFESPFREGQLPTNAGAAGYAISPDGTRLVYRAVSEQSQNQLWVRRWDDPEAAPIRGTESGIQPAFSPAGSRLAFAASGEIKVVSLDGGPVQTVADGNWPVWGTDGYIYVRTETDAIGRVAETGGPIEAVAESPSGENLFALDALPSGKGLIVRVGNDVAALHIGTGEITRLVEGVNPEYSASGHVLYVAPDGTLMAVGFDADALEVVGPHVPLEEDIQAFAISDTGKLFYSRSGGVQAEFVWVSRTGQAAPVQSGWTFDWGGVNPGWSLSPDGTRLAYRSMANENDDLWIKDLPDGPNARLTFDEANDGSPRWSHDGEMLVFASGRAGGGDLWTKPADGTGQATLIYDDPDNIIDGSWHPDGQWLVLRTYPGGTTGRDIVGLRTGSDSVSVPLMAENYDERAPALSPDGRWLAYVSDETGSQEVFVRPFPDVDSGRWQLSTEGGIMPVWAHSGDELFFVNGQNAMTVVEIDTSSGFQPLRSEVLFTIPTGVRTSSSNILFDVSNDDQQFLMARWLASASGAASAYVLVNNYAGELKRLVPN